MATYTTEQLLSTILSVEFYNAKTIDAIVSELSADTLSAAENYVSESLNSIQTSLSNYAICSDFANIEDLKTDGSETAHTIIDKINEILGKLKVADGSSPSPDSGSSLPEYDKYAFVTRDEHTIYDENNNPMYEEGHQWDSDYELKCIDKCLVGFDSNGNPTILKQTSDCGRFSYSTTPPENPESDWPGYELDPSYVNFYTEESWDGDPTHVTRYGFNVGVNELGAYADYTWGDSNYPYIMIEEVSREDAEDYFNS